ncbi:MAG: RidA family protein [Phycisphaerales bacterium]|nr:RidA family protein [Phycisphaerales bacterium]
MSTHSPNARLAALGITLPSPTAPVGTYLPCVRHGDLLMLSGQIPFQAGSVVFTGRVGGNGLSLEDAQHAARLCAVNALGIAAHAVGGLENVARVLKVVVYVASNPGFTDQPKVANGASDLFYEVFGDAGRHARAAVGVAELPLNASVEVDVTFVVKHEARPGA